MSPAAQPQVIHAQPEPGEVPVEAANAAPAATDPNVVHLKYPIDVQGVHYSCLTLRRPKVDDLLAADAQGGSDAAKEVFQFARITGTTPAVIKQLDLADYLAVQKRFQGFLA